jgi:transcription termination factor Rho
MPTFENLTESGNAVLSFDETSADQHVVYGSLAEEVSAPQTFGVDNVASEPRRGRPPKANSIAKKDTAGGIRQRGRPRKHAPQNETTAHEPQFEAQQAQIPQREKVYVVPDSEDDMPPDDPFANFSHEEHVHVPAQRQHRERQQNRSSVAPNWNGNSSRFRGSTQAQPQERFSRNTMQRGPVAAVAHSQRRENYNTAQNAVQPSCQRRVPFGNLGSWEKLQSITSIEAAYDDMFQSDDVLNFEEIYALQGARLEELAVSLGIQWAQGDAVRQQVIDACLRQSLANRKPIAMEGYLDIFQDGNGCLTQPRHRFQIVDWSPFVPRAIIRHYGLRIGQFLRVRVTLPRDNASMACVVRVESVMSMSHIEARKWPQFRELTPFYPTERMMLENAAGQAAQNLSMRIVDLIAPIGLGQRGLLVAPPRTGTAVWLQAFATSLTANRPDVHMMILLIDERPEEVTDFRRMAQCEVFASTFDESADNHVRLAEIVIEHARRCVECGQHVVILLDSITRLARAYNTVMPASGRILTGGIDANALQGPKSFFGSARNIEGGGSLTILGTALVETGSRMDDVIFEEFKGTGNMELHLDRELADKRIYPAINIGRSGTRKEELLYHPDELVRIHLLRRALLGLAPSEAIEMLQQRMKKTRTNVEFLVTLNRN